MSTSRKKFNLFNKKGIILFGIFLFIAIADLILVYLGTARIRNQFNQQAQAITKVSTGYLVRNFDLYSNPTVKFSNLVSGYLAENPSISGFEVFNTEGEILFSTAGKEGKVTQKVLEDSRSDALSVYRKRNLVNEIVSPYFDEWGAHKYSVLFAVNQKNVLNEIFKFHFQILGVSAVVIVASVASASLYIMREEYLVKKKEQKELEIIDQQRQEFLILAAHHLRTPLSTLKGFASLLSESKLTEDQRKLVTPLEAGANQLGELVENILAITSVLGDPDARIYKEEVEIKKVLDEILLELSPELKEKMVTLNIEVSKSLSIKANEKYFKLVLKAIIDNAIKFNRNKGKIEISAKSNKGKIKISVSDQGVGIPIKERDKIFGGFHKGNESLLTYNYEGSGLGLYMSKLLTEFMSGEIDFVSEVGKGTTFFLSFPENNS